MLQALKIRIARIGAAAAAAAMLVSSCATPARADPLAGRYDVKGGGAPLDVFTALSDEFRKKHPSVRFDFEDVGSAAGIKLVAAGDVDLATSSALPAAEFKDKVTLVPVGVSGTAVVVNAANPVTALNRAQVRDLFAGTVTDWSKVGGRPEKVFVVIREPTSALRSNFDSYFFEGKATYAPDAIELNSGKDVIQAVVSRSSVVSMITIDGAALRDTRIRLLTIDGIAPTKENLSSGTYPVRRPLYLIYNEKTVRPAVRAFLDFAKSPEGLQIIDNATTGP